MTGCLFKLIQNAWDTETVSQEWKDASIIHYLRKAVEKSVGITGAYLFYLL